jgi:hypothetical protein
VASRPRVRPAAAPRAVDPPVIVPAAEREALLTFYRSLRRPVMLASAAPDRIETTGPQPLVISPLLMPALGEEMSFEGGLR